MDKTFTDIFNDKNILVLNVNQVSKILGMGLSTTYKYVKKQDCPFIVHRIGSLYKINKKSLAEYLNLPITT